MISLKNYGIDFVGPIEEAVKLPPQAIPTMKIEFGATGTYWKMGCTANSSARYLQHVGPVKRWDNVEKWFAYEKRGNKYVKQDEVYEKCAEGGQLFREICLQIFARQEFARHGFEKVIPEVHDILRKDGNEISFTMTPFLNVVNMHEALSMVGDSGLKGRGFDMWFIPVLVQIIVFLGILEEKLLMNHRDLKGDNILLTLDQTQKQKEIELGGKQWSFTFREEVRLIDFGFACRGEAMNGPSTIVAGGEIFGQKTMCPKGGRDIYMLLCYFYGLPSFRQNASAQLIGFIKGLLGPTIVQHLERHNLDRIDTIYLLLGRADFQSESCCFMAVLNKISELWPALLTYT